MMAAAIGSGSSAQSKHAPPGLAGLWETETAVALLNGELDGAGPDTRTGVNAAGPPAQELALFRRVKLWNKPPYNAEWEAKSRAAAAPAGAGDIQQLVKACGPSGFPALMENPTSDGMFQLVVTPEETLILIPNGDVRQIFTDGRGHPQGDNLWPTLLGDSIGTWNGKSLIIDTIARKAGPIVPLPIPGMANLSDQAHFTERLQLIDPDTLQNEMTIADPQRLSHSWRVSIRYKRVTEVDRLIPINCAENDRDTVVNGKLTIAPP